MRGGTSVPIEIRPVSLRPKTTEAAFDLIELDGDDLRGDPLAMRKATLASLLRRAAPGLRFCEHLDHEDGPLVFAHACKMDLEGIVSKRKDVWTGKHASDSEPG